MINGTDGSVYAPYIKKTDVLYIFVPDLCRFVSHFHSHAMIVRFSGSTSYSTCLMSLFAISVSTVMALKAVLASGHFGDNVQ